MVTTSLVTGEQRGTLVLPRETKPSARERCAAKEKRVEWKGDAAKAAALAAHSREPVLQGQAERRGEGSEQSAFPSPSSFKVTHCLKEEARFSESLAEEENFLSRTSALFTLGRAAASLLLCVCAADVVDNAINAPNHPFGSAFAVE
ncbi:hypothetical protein MRX96_005361 [Rhipicephalus microplus]